MGFFIVCSLVWVFDSVCFLVRAVGSSRLSKAARWA